MYNVINVKTKKQKIHVHKIKKKQRRASKIKQRNGPYDCQEKFLKVMTFNLGCEGHIGFAPVNKGEEDIYYRQREHKCRDKSLKCQGVSGDL